MFFIALITPRNQWQQVRLDSAPDERRDLERRQVRHAMNRDAGPLPQVNVTRPVVTDGVEQGDQPPVSLVVHGVGKEHRVKNHEPGLFCHFPMQRFLHGFASLDATPEPGPATRMGNSRLVVTVMHEQPIASHDEQHRRPGPRRSLRPCHFCHAAQA
jgi:hypothetical protein